MANIAQGMIISMAALWGSDSRSPASSTHALIKKPAWVRAGSELLLQSLVLGRCEHCLRSVLEDRARGIYKTKLLSRTGLHWIFL